MGATQGPTYPSHESTCPQAPCPGHPESYLCRTPHRRLRQEPRPGSCKPRAAATGARQTQGGWILPQLPDSAQGSTPKGPTSQDLGVAKATEEAGSSAPPRGPGRTVTGGQGRQARSGTAGVEGGLGWPRPHARVPARAGHTGVETTAGDRGQGHAHSRAGLRVLGRGESTERLAGGDAGAWPGLSGAGSRSSSKQAGLGREWRGQEQRARGLFVPPPPPLTGPGLLPGPNCLFQATSTAQATEVPMLTRRWRCGPPGPRWPAAGNQPQLGQRPAVWR